MDFYGNILLFIICYRLLTILNIFKFIKYDIYLYILSAYVLLCSPYIGDTIDGAR